MKTKFTSIFAKAATLLLMMLLTTTTAWAAKTEQFPIYTGDEGTSNKPYQIKTIDDLNKLAADVNSGTTYSGKYFQLVNDLDFYQAEEESLRPKKTWNDATSTESNFTPIGNFNHNFCGHFDGNNMTISGLRVYSTESRQGLFGIINNAEVKNVTLADARIAGESYTGGIVGHSENGTVTGCSVADNVAVVAISGFAFGGIAGYNNKGTVSSCFSAVKISVAAAATAGYKPFFCGGIVGENCSTSESVKATLTDNIVIGAVIPTANYKLHAAIAADDNSGTGSNNKHHVSYARNYYFCTVAEAENVTNVGIATHNGTSTATTGDITENDGAIYTLFYTLTHATGITATATAAGTYDGKLYCKPGTEVTLSGKQSTSEPPAGCIYGDGYVVTKDGTNPAETVDMTTTNTFLMPASDVTVTSNIIQCYTLTLTDGITATATPTITVGGTDYYKPGTTVTLNYTGTLSAGYGPVYTMTKDGTSVGVTTPGTFSMPASNVTISVTVTDLWGVSANPAADGSAEHPYVITTPAGLDLLATKVSDGDGYGGKYFVLGNDITYPYTTDWDDATSQENNFTSIGMGFELFSGIFDGQGHTVSGIRIYSAHDHQGLFGCINDGIVRNVTLADARITGKNRVGGIAGYNNGTIKNCHATATVLIGSAGDGASYHGGIAGVNYSTVDGCTSSATLSQATYCGGIVGSNNIDRSVIKNCLAIGVTIYRKLYVGAIAGSNYGGTLSHNYYNGCTVGSATSGIGCDGADITDNDGAVPATILSDAVTTLPKLNEGDKVAFHRQFTGGKASTVVFPFAYTPSVEEGTYYAFSGVSYDDKEGKWIATMTSAVTPLAANTPYLFMPTGSSNIAAVLFHGEAAASISAGTTTSGDWQFKGVYAQKTWAAADCGRDYGFAATSGKAVDGVTDIEAGEFVKLAEGAWIRPLRAYLTYTGTGNPWATTNAPQHRAGSELPQCISVRLVNDDGDTTDLENVQCSMFNVQCDSGWYTLTGRQLMQKPTQKGLYIHGGKKVVIK